MQVLDPLTMPLDGRRLIEASAGTGKTWTLTFLFLRLLLQGGLPVEQILVLTFTRAATAELRERIRLRIHEALSQLSGQTENPDPLLAALLQSLPKEKSTLLLKTALASIDEASVYTIHGFCQRILKEHAFEAGCVFDLELMENEDALQMQIMADFWRNRFYPLGYGESALVAATWENPAGLLNMLRRALRAQVEAPLPHLKAADMANDRDKMLKALHRVQQAWAKDGAQLTELLMNDHCLSRSQKNYSPAQVAIILEAMDELSTSAHFPWMLADQLELLTETAICDRLLKKKVCTEWGPPSFFHTFEEFWQLRVKFLGQWKIGILQEAYTVLQQERQQRKARKRQLSYDDLLTRLGAALQHKESGQTLARTLAERFKAVLIDEFQDTDPVQYRIFSQICAQASHPFFMIGDPKQAIYSFRGGDIFTYMQAQRQTPAPRQYTMGVNYRSTPAMVLAVNILFENNPHAFVFSADIPFFPVQSSGKTMGQITVESTSLSPLNALLLQEEETGKELSKQNAEEQATIRTASTIQYLLNLAEEEKVLIDGRRLQSSDIAILVYSHREAELMRLALAKRGLNSIYASQLSVFSSIEAEEIRYLLRSCLSPKNHALAARVLASSLYGLNASEIFALQQDERLWAQQLREHTEDQEHWSRFGITAMLHRLFAKEEITHRLTAQPGGERRLTNLLHLADLLQEEEENSSSPEQLLRWLGRQMDNAAREESANRLMRLESDARLIQISTQHRAKGLEFNLVFLPFLWRAHTTGKKKEEPIQFHDRTSLNLCLDFDTSNKRHLDLAAQEEQAEDMRLFYVAITRACYACFFCWGRVLGFMDTPMARLLHPTEKPSDMEKMRTALCQLNSKNNILNLQTSDFFVPATGRNPTKTSPGEEGALHLTAREFTGSIRTGHTISSYTRLSANQHATSPLEETIEIIKAPQPEDFANILTFPRGTRPGLCLHFLLENLDLNMPIGKQTALLMHGLEQFGFDVRWLPALTNWLQNLVHIHLPGSCALHDIQASDVLHELSFLFPVHRLSTARLNALLLQHGFPPVPERSGVLQGLMKGFVDLVFRYKGKYFLVDYKSNHLGESSENYNHKNLLPSMNQHNYHLQYLLYSLALHRHLQKRLPGYAYAKHFGGVYYLFLRGMQPGWPVGSGIFHTRPEEGLIESFDALFRDYEVNNARA